MKLPRFATSCLSALVVIFIWNACGSSGKVAFEHGNYYQAVLTSVDRLRRSTDHEKSQETLRQAYPLALQYHQDRANVVITSTTEFKWREAVKEYTLLHSMYDEIRRSPGALKIVPNPTSYLTKLNEAKQNAAEECYAAGDRTMALGGFANAKKAYYLFVDCNGYVPGYKDVNRKMEEAKWAATVKVAIEPLPALAKNYAINSQSFDNMINETVRKNYPSEFVKFFTQAEARAQKVTPDHIVQMSFTEFSVSQTNLNEKESKQEKDSVVVAVTYSDAKGAMHRKDFGPVNQFLPGNAGKLQPDKEKADKEKADKEKADKDAADKAEKERLEKEKADKEKADKEKADKEKAEKEKADKDAADKAEKERLEKEKADKEKADKEKADKEKAEKEKADKDAADKAEKERLEKEKADKEKADKEKAQEEKVTICHVVSAGRTERKTMTVPKAALQAHLDHGDELGECKEQDEKNDDKGKKKDNEANNETASIGDVKWQHNKQVLIASNGSLEKLWSYIDAAPVDTTKIYGKVNATVRQYKKTVTSKGVLTMRIVDAKTKAVLSEMRVPGEHVWTSEWLTFNGDGRALSEEQMRLANQKEKAPPSNQDLFSAVTQPMIDQLASKIREFYKNY